MAVSQSSVARSLPSGIYSPLTSTSLRTQSSLNSALRNATMAAESSQAEEEEEEEEGRGAEFQRLEEGEEVLKPALVHENGRRQRGGSTAMNRLNGDLTREELENLTSGLSTAGSLPLEDLSEEDEMASSSDSEPFEASELELIEAALRSLRSVKEDVEVSRALEHNHPGSSDLQDLQDVSRLLKKVQAVKARKREKHMTPIQVGNFRQGPSGGENTDPGDIRQVVQAAAQTALAAANTAEMVVSSLNRNSQAMEDLCRALRLGHSLHQSPEDAEEDEEEGKNLLAIELKQTEIAKSLVWQNRVTHWVLGFIVVSSFVWRYGVVKFVKKVNNTITNPFQGFTDMLSGQKEQAEKEHNIPQLRFPGIPDDNDERKRDAGEEKENNTFSFPRIFSGMNDDEDEAKQRQAEQRREKKPKEEEGKQFNLGNFFRGLKGEEERKAEEEKHKQKQKQKAKKGKEDKSRAAVFSRV